MNGTTTASQLREIDMFDFQATVGITTHIGGEAGYGRLRRCAVCWSHFG